MAYLVPRHRLLEKAYTTKLQKYDQASNLLYLVNTNELKKARHVVAVKLTEKIEI